MERDEKLVIIDSIIIIILVLIIAVPIIRENFIGLDKNAYCSKHYDDNKCLLSARVYANILSSNNNLILNLKPLQNDIRNYISENKIKASVYIQNLRDGASFGINSNLSYPAASLNKLPVAILIMKKIEARQLSLDTQLSITNDKRDSQSGTLYLRNISELSVKELLRYMLSESDNTALFVLQNQLTMGDLDKLSDYVDFYSNEIMSDSGQINSTQTNPKAVSNIFTSLYLSTYLEAKDAELVLTYLSNSTFEIKKYANIPEDIIISQKDGFRFSPSENYLHDCGIIYIDKSRFSYCIMTKNMDEKKAQEAIGMIVNKLYNFVVEQNQLNPNL